MTSSELAQVPPQSRRETILTVAAESFAQHGFHAVSIRDIARASGCSTGTLYNHFTDKDDLLCGIAYRLFSAIQGDLEAVLAEPTDGFTRLQTMLRVAVGECRAYRNEFLTITHDTRHIGATPKLAEILARRDAVLDVWRRLFDAGMKDGSIRSDIDPAAALWILASVITGIVDEQTAARFAGTPIGDSAMSLLVMLMDGLRGQT